MATAAYIAWLIVKITFFLVVLSNLGVLSMQVIKVLIVMSILCLTFLLGVWLFAPEYLP